MTSPQVVRYIPLTYDQAQGDSAALDLVHELYPEWKDANGQVKVTPVSAGIMNIVNLPASSCLAPSNVTTHSFTK